MKKARHIFLTSIIAVLTTFAVIVYTSCKTKCGGIVCQNGGACSDNLCVCALGYSGNACQTGWSTESVGTYNCTRSDCQPAISGSSSTWQSAVTVDATNGGYTIDISNFNNSGATVAATIDSNINGIAQVRIDESSGTSGVQATGTYDSTTSIINMQFTADASGGVSGYRCNMVMIKEK